MRPRAGAVRALLVLLLTAACAVGAAPQRLAWVVGQEAYPNARLRTVARDAQHMGHSLSTADWVVRQAPIDAPPDVLHADLLAFVEQVRNSPGAEVFVYLSGHGVEVDGGARLRLIAPASDGRKPAMTLAVADVLATLEAAGASRAVLVFDACRDTRTAAAYRPLLAAGTGRPRPARRDAMEHLVLYATASGTLAEDGVASGGRFTNELIAALNHSGMSVQDAFERARRAVWASTQGRQRPEMAVSSGAVLFKAAGPTAKAEPAANTGDAQQLAEARKLLGTGPSVVRSPVADDDQETERDINVAMHLLFPLKQESLDTLEQLVAQGMPWAALVLRMNLTGWFVGSDEPARARQMGQQLRRAGLKARLDAMHRKGSHAAAMALALLDSERDDESQSEKEGLERAQLELLRGAARGGYEPALQLYLLLSASKPALQDEVAREAEQLFRDRAATGSLPAQWTLALLTFTRTYGDLDKDPTIDQAAARAGMVAAAQPMVDKGVPFASTLLITAYLSPRLGPPDFAAIDQLCERVRQARNARAIHACALSWAGTSAPRQDAVRALAWMREAADLGDTDAANQAGLWLYEGFGAKPDTAAAFPYFERCALRGGEQCLLNAAYALRAGVGTKRDVHRAQALYETAASQGSSTAGNALARMLIEEHALPRDDAAVRRWLMHGIERKDAQAWTTLAELTRDGRAGVEKEPVEARKLFEKAAQMGSRRAQARVCEMQVTGEGGPRNFGQGMDCLEDLVKEGDLTAKVALARLLLEGEGGRRDAPRAFVLYAEAEERGEVGALAHMGRFFEFGLAGQAIDPAMARRMYAHAADAGSLDGLAYLGASMTSQQASPDERRAGIVHLERAAAKGHAIAQRLLDQERAVSATRR